MKEIDFLPHSYHQAVRRRTERRRNLLMCVGLALAMICLHGLNVTRIRSAEAALSAMRNGSGAWQSAQARLSALEKQKASLRERLDLISRLEDAAPLNAAIGEIAGLMTGSMAIRELSVETASPDAAGRSSVPLSPQTAAQTGGVVKAGISSPTETRVRMTGVAATDVEVGIFLGKMGACPLFSNVTLGYSREERAAGRKMREFEVSCTIRPVEDLP